MSSPKRSERPSSRREKSEKHALHAASTNSDTGTPCSATLTTYSCDHWGITPDLSSGTIEKVKQDEQSPAWTFSSNHDHHHETCPACRAGIALGEKPYHVALKGVDDDSLRKLIEDSLTYALMSRGLESRRYFNLGSKMIRKISKRGGDSLIRRGLEGKVENMG